MRNVIIVGASSSVGSAVVDAFLAYGDNVISTYNNKNIPNSIHLDLIDNTSIISFPLRAGIQAGSIDVVIFLSSMLPGKDLINYKDDDLERVMTINFTGQVKLLRSLFPYLSEKSHIIMLSSVSGQRGSFDPIYAASKSAVLGFVKSLATNLGPNKRINTIAPGLIKDSAMYNQMSTERQELHRNNTPIKSLLEINDLAKIIVDITLPHWAHINGACIDVNGGQYVR